MAGLSTGLNQLELGMRAAFDKMGLTTASTPLPFGTIIQSRSMTELSIYGSGAGGDANTIWISCYNPDTVFEVNSTDLSVIRSKAVTIWPYGCGGDANTIWYSDYSTRKVYELDTSDLSTIRSSAVLRTWYGCGGGANVIWVSDTTTNIYELSPTDMSTVRSALSFSGFIRGIGGNENVIYVCVNTSSTIYELSPTDFSVIQSSPTVGANAGIGGDENVIWLLSYAEVLYQVATGN